MKLTEGQLRFLEKELSVTKEDISVMGKEQWHEIREKCFDIEVEEAVKEDSDDEVDWERCDVAASIADIKFSELNSVV